MRVARRLLPALVTSMLVAVPLGTAIGSPADSSADPEDAPQERDEPADTAPGAEAVDASGGPEPMNPEACTDVFGDAEIQARHADSRAFELSWIERRGDVVQITHSARWKRPYYVEFSGLEVLDVTPGADGAGTARVRIDRGAGGEAACPDGVYEIGPDVALGGSARVLGFIDEGLIVEHDGNLAYMLEKKALPPTWQMVWRAPWYIVRRNKVTSSASSSKSRSRSRTSKNRRARKKTKRR